MSEKFRPIGIYYEHPEWFRPLFAELDRRGIPFVKLNAESHRYDPSERAQAVSLLVNRMSPSAYLRGHGQGIFYTLNYLEHVERSGTPVVNGRAAFTIETSKALQLSLLESLGLRYPRTRIINNPADARSAAEGLRFPVVVKANIGGSGAGIVRYDTPEALAAAAAGDFIRLGLDQTALVQEFIPARGGHITRVETLDGRFLYAIKVFTTGDVFNLCPADICRPAEAALSDAGACPAETPKKGVRIERFTPPPEVIESVERIARAAQLDLGGVEYIVDDRDGQLLYYDINALSNFVADARRILGFDPHVQLVDYLARRVVDSGQATGKGFAVQPYTRPAAIPAMAR